MASPSGVTAPSVLATQNPRPVAVGEAKTDGELSPLERAFIEFHQRALTEGPGFEPEGEDTRQPDGRWMLSTANR